MNGLLDPTTLALLSASGGLLQASGPSRLPQSTGQALGAGLLGGVNAYQEGTLANQRYGLMQGKIQEFEMEQAEKKKRDAMLQQFAQSLPPQERERFLIDPPGYLKATQEKQPQPYTLAPGATRYGADNQPIASSPVSTPQQMFAPSSLGKLIQERNALPPDSPLVQAYDKAIKNASESQERSPSIQFFPGVDALYGLNRRTGAATEVRSPSGAPIIAPQNSPALQGNIAGSKAAAKEEGEARTTAKLDLPRVVDNARNNLQLIDQMVGSEDGKTKPHPGFSSAVGLRVPGLGMIPGSDTSNFNVLLDQVKGGAFLEAFNSLKGGGQITEVEGKKATDAITRMQNAQSEKEFVKAAREYQQIIRLGVDRAQGKAGVSAPANNDPLGIRR